MGYFRKKVCISYQILYEIKTLFNKSLTNHHKHWPNTSQPKLWTKHLAKTLTHSLKPKAKKKQKERRISYLPANPESTSICLTNRQSI